MTTNIYILICPISKQIKYVGKANDPKRRLKDHMIDFRSRLGEFEKTKWLLELYRKNLKPEMEIVDTVDMNDWKKWEQFWIEYFISIGCILVNSGKGGNGLSTANEQSFKQGNRPWNYGLKMKKDDTKSKHSSTKRTRPRKILQEEAKGI